MRPPLGRATPWGAACTSSELLVLAAINHHWPNPYPSLARLHQLTRLAPSTVARLLSTMRARRWISWASGNGPNQTSNRYTIHWDAIPQATASLPDHRIGISTAKPPRSAATASPVIGPEELQERRTATSTATAAAAAVEKPKRNSTAQPLTAPPLAASKNPTMGKATAKALTPTPPLSGRLAATAPTASPQPADLASEHQPAGSGRLAIALPELPPDQLTAHTIRQRQAQRQQQIAQYLERLLTHEEPRNLEHEAAALRARALERRTA